MAEKLRGFRHMVFNVRTHNRDDHVKNVSFLMEDDGTWRLAPAYDLTYAPGPGGEHSMSVLGEGKAPGSREILALGRKDMEMERICDEVSAAVGQWVKFAEEAGVTEKSKGALGKVFAEIARMF